MRMVSPLALDRRLDGRQPGAEREILHARRRSAAVCRWPAGAASVPATVASRLIRPRARRPFGGEDRVEGGEVDLAGGAQVHRAGRVERRGAGQRSRLRPAVSVASSRAVSPCRVALAASAAAGSPAAAPVVRRMPLAATRTVPVGFDGVPASFASASSRPSACRSGMTMRARSAVTLRSEAVRSSVGDSRPGHVQHRLAQAEPQPVHRHPVGEREPGRCQQPQRLALPAGLQGVRPPALRAGASSVAAARAASRRPPTPVRLAASPRASASCCRSRPAAPRRRSRPARTRVTSSRASVAGLPAGSRTRAVSVASPTRPARAAPALRAFSSSTADRRAVGCSVLQRRRRPAPVDAPPDEGGKIGQVADRARHRARAAAPRPAAGRACPRHGAAPVRALMVHAACRRPRGSPPAASVSGAPSSVPSAVIVPVGLARQALCPQRRLAPDCARTRGGDVAVEVGGDSEIVGAARRPGRSRRGCRARVPASALRSDRPSRQPRAPCRRAARRPPPPSAPARRPAAVAARHPRHAAWRRAPSVASGPSSAGTGAMPPVTPSLPSSSTSCHRPPSAAVHAERRAALRVSTPARRRQRPEIGQRRVGLGRQRARGARGALARRPADGPARTGPAGRARRAGRRRSGAAARRPARRGFGPGHAQPLGGGLKRAPRPRCPGAARQAAQPRPRPLPARPAAGCRGDLGGGEAGRAHAPPGSCPARPRPARGRIAGAARGHIDLARLRRSGRPCPWRRRAARRRVTASRGRRVLPRPSAAAVGRWRPARAAPRPG